MKNIIITFFVGVCLLLSSCKSFLDPESKTEYIPRDAAALNTLLINGGMTNDNIMSLLGLQDDDVACQPSGVISLSAERVQMAFEMFTWQPNYYKQFMSSPDYAQNYVNNYAMLYQCIKNINAVLDYADEVSGPEPMRNYVKGQAYALRAWYYFLLVNEFAPPYNKNNLDAPGVVLKLVSAASLAGSPRATVGRTYEQLVSDLLDSEKSFNEAGDVYAYKKNYRINLPTAQLLLSRVYLYMGEWQKSADYATKVIETGRQVMLNLETAKYGSYNHLDIHSYNNSEVMWVTGKLSDAQYLNSTKAKDGNYTANFTVFRASDDLVALMERDKGDLRRTKYMRADVAIFESDPSYKYEYYRPTAKHAVDNRLNIPGGYIYSTSFRLCEAYLNRAEANAMLFKEAGKGECQINAINDLRTLHTYRFTAGTAPTLSPASADELVQLTRDERRKELCFENHRWNDLRRYGMPEIKHVWCASATERVTYTLRAGDFGYTLAIPDPAMDQNDALVQNPLGARRTN